MTEFNFNRKYDSNNGCGFLIGVAILAFLMVVVLGTFGGALLWLIWTWMGVGVAVGAPEPIATLGFWNCVGLMWVVRLLLPAGAVRQ